MKYIFILFFAICGLNFDSKISMWDAVRKAVDYAEAHHLIHWAITADDDSEGLHSCVLNWKE